MLSRFVVLFVNLRTIYGADNNALPAKSGGQNLIPNNQNRFVRLSGNAVYRFLLAFVRLIFYCSHQP